MQMMLRNRPREAERKDGCAGSLVACIFVCRPWLQSFAQASLVIFLSALRQRPSDVNVTCARQLVRSNCILRHCFSVGCKWAACMRDHHTKTGNVEEWRPLTLAVSNMPNRHSAASCGSAKHHADELHRRTLPCRHFTLRHHPALHLERSRVSRPVTYRVSGHCDCLCSLRKHGGHGFRGVPQVDSQSL